MVLSFSYPKPFDPTMIRSINNGQYDILCHHAVGYKNMKNGKRSSFLGSRSYLRFYLTGWSFQSLEIIETQFGWEPWTLIIFCDTFVTFFQWYLVQSWSQLSEVFHLYTNLTLDIFFIEQKNLKKPKLWKIFILIQRSILMFSIMIPVQCSLEMLWLTI